MRQFSLLVCSLIAAILAGCATGGFKTSLSDEELPVTDQPSPYPTAVDPGDREVSPAKSSAKAAPTVTVLPALATPLAMVPSPLRMNRAPEPLAVAMPNQMAKAPALEPASNASAPSPSIAPSPPPTDDEGFAPIVAAADLRAARLAVAPSAETGSLPTTMPVQALVDQPAAQSAPAVVPSTIPATVQLEQPRPSHPQSSQHLVPIISSVEDRLAAIGQQRDVLIAMLEEDIQHRKSAAGSATDQELPRLEQQLRLLYAVSDRPDDAVRAIDNLSDPEREAYKHLMFGLNTWFADHQAQRAPFRAARVLRSLREASSELAAASKLDLRNLAFCERVESFGWFTEFSRNEFVPKQQVILYVEVDNFSAQEKSPHSFETELQGHYQIFDARGNIVAERKLPLDREVCRNIRRDYFLAYPIYLPDSIEPGRYRLELTIEDLKANGEYKGRKFGEGTIEFSVRS